MKRLLLLVLFLFISGIVFFYFYTKRNQEVTNRLIYNNYTNKWDQTSKTTPIDQERESILESNNNQDGMHNLTILKGFFDSYDETNHELTIKAAVAFTNDSLFEIANLKMSSNQTIYCAPSIYTDPNTGKDYETTKLGWPVKNAATIWIPTEKELDFDRFLKDSNKLTPLYIQLTRDYEKEETNYVKKMIVIGLCEEN